MQQATNKIIETIHGINDGYSPRQIFCDWVKACALCTVNSFALIHNKIWEEREKEFKNTMLKYRPETQQKFTDMLGMLCMAMDEEMTDFLGEIFMKLEAGSSHGGQFFTPYHVSVMTAKLGLEEDIKEGRKKFELYEPSVGSGGMIIAAAQILREAGYDYQKCMKVVGQDLDWNAVYMTYLQLSMYGINATVIQGDSLGRELSISEVDPRHVFHTPMKAGILL